jgi:hypothetical protein
VKNCRPSSKGILPQRGSPRARRSGERGSRRSTSGVTPCVSGARQLLSGGGGADGGVGREGAMRCGFHERRMALLGSDRGNVCPREDRWRNRDILLRLVGTRYASRLKPDAGRTTGRRTPCRRDCLAGRRHHGRRRGTHRNRSNPERNASARIDRNLENQSGSNASGKCSCLTDAFRQQGSRNPSLRGNRRFHNVFERFNLRTQLKGDIYA